jgi:hypothetical protein
MDENIIDLHGRGGHAVPVNRYRCFQSRRRSCHPQSHRELDAATDHPYRKREPVQDLLGEPRQEGSGARGASGSSAGQGRFTSALPLSLEDFLDVVAQDLEISPEAARERTRAVFATLREAITLGEFRDVLEQLDPEYADLLA